MYRKVGVTAHFPTAEITHSHYTLTFKDDPTMGFLSGPVSFQCFQTEGDAPRQFGSAEIKTLTKFAVSQMTASAEQPAVGFLGGDHLLDLAFSLEKNVIGDALHCGIRIDSPHQIPAAVRNGLVPTGTGRLDRGRSR